MTTSRGIQWLHAGYTVANLGRVMAFLRDCLGFELVSVGPPRVPGLLGRIVGVPDADATIAYLRRDGATLELLEYHYPADRPPPAALPCDAGFAHLALACNAVPSMVASAADFGFHPIAPPVLIPEGPNAGKFAVYLQDADGFTVELIGTGGAP